MRIGRKWAAVGGLLCGVIVAIGIAATQRNNDHGKQTKMLSARPPRGVVLISIDTLRADHMSLYGYGRKTTPHIDAWAKNAIVFQQAVVQLPGTLPSHITMMTSLYPRQHGVYPPDHVLPADIKTVAECFKEAKFKTAAFTEGGYVSARYGFSRGFDTFKDNLLFWKDVLTEAENFLATLKPSDSFFLFLHTYQVHDPYEPPDEYRHLFVSPDMDFNFPHPPEGDFLTEINRGNLPTLPPAQVDALKALYDAEIRYMSDQFPRLLKALDLRGLRKHTMIMFTSDHGEEFMEHGRFVHEQLFAPTLRVPMIIEVPGWSGRREVKEVVETLDVAPTLLSYAGIPIPDQFVGTDLIATAGQTADQAATYSFSESFTDPEYAVQARLDGRDYKLILRDELEWEEEGWLVQTTDLVVHSNEPVFVLAAFHRPRRVSVYAQDQLVTVWDVSTELDEFRLPLPGPEDGFHSIRLVADTCDVPDEILGNGDKRCLSMLARKTATVPLNQVFVFDLQQDPAESNNIADEQPRLTARLLKQLNKQRDELNPVSQAVSVPLEPELEERLNALGYLN